MGSIQFFMFPAKLPVQPEKAVKDVGANEGAASGDEYSQGCLLLVGSRPGSEDNRNRNRVATGWAGMGLVG